MRLPKSRAASPELPDGESEPFGPFKIDQEGSWLILNDIHLPYHDTEALQIAVKHAKKRKVTGIILNGDIFDCPGLSSKFLKEPSKVQVKGGLETGKKFFAWLRNHFPKCRIVWKLGNHEARLYDYILRNAPALYDLDGLKWENITSAEGYGIEVMEDDTQTIELGKLPIAHGHEFARGLAVPVNPARGLFLKAKTSAMCGHHHVTSTHPEKDIKGKPIFCWTVGALCGLQPRYARKNNWNHGFAEVEVYKDGTYDVANHRIYEGRVA